MKRLLQKIRGINDNVKIVICRWWFSAAVCFFIAFGLNLGNQETTFELIFFLGLGMGIANILLFNPIIMSVFDIKRRGKIANKKMSERTVLEGTFYLLSEIFKSMFSVYIVSWIYQGINVAINTIKDYPSTHVNLGVEPILFGVFFVVVYQLLGLVWDLIVYTFNKIKKEKVNKHEENTTE